MAKISDLQMNRMGYILTPKTYFMLIWDITEKLQINSTISYHFGDITAANHKPINAFIITRFARVNPAL